MKSASLLIFLIIGICWTFAASSSLGQSIDSMPPVVVKTSPESGRTDVVPGVVEIHVAFSKEMADESWSWSTAWKGSTPAIIGQPRYEPDHRTATIKVKLEPGKTYGFWLNSQNFHGFRDRQGHSAVPYLLVFKTNTGGEPPSTQPAVSEATTAAEAWLKLLDARQYDQAWQEMSGFAQKAVTQADMTKSLEGALTPLGKVTARKLISVQYVTSLPGAPDGEYVVMQFQTQFENKDSATETVTPMKDQDGKWKVSGCYIK